jgi:multicomponent Na+:H+ antiporter subunit D
MNNLVALPVLIPLITAITLLCVRNIRVQRLINLTGTALLFIAAILLLRTVFNNGIQVLRFGDWPAPFAIVFAVDMLTALMIVVTGFVALNAAVFCLGAVDPERERFGLFPLMNVLLMGVCGAFMTGDLFNLYVWFEVMLMASFVLMALGGQRQQIEGAVKYLSLNFIASIFFLTAIGIIYGKTGTLNMADLSYRIAETAPTDLIKTSSVLLLIAFGIKAGIFPLYFWLPASYHTPPAVISAIFAGLLTKVGVYALIRTFTLIFGVDLPFIQPLLYITAGLTMVSGVLGAASQFDFRRILSFHIISQIGYMIMGLALYTPLALAAAVFYIFHHIIVKTNLFLISGITARLQGTYQIKKLHGLYRNYPLLATVFFIAAFSLGGIPPLSGFFAKFIVIKAGLISKQYLLVLTAVLVGILTLYSMTKIWAEAFWSEAGDGSETLPAIPAGLLIPAFVMASATVLIGVFANQVFEMCEIAAQQLMDPTSYIQTVLWGTQ